MGLLVKWGWDTVTRPVPGNQAVVRAPAVALRAPEVNRYWLRVRRVHGRRAEVVGARRLVDSVPSPGAHARVLPQPSGGIRLPWLGPAP